MLVRVIKPNCDGLHDTVKTLLTWAFTKKRKFHLSNPQGHYKENWYDEDQFERKKKYIPYNKKPYESGHTSKNYRQNFDDFWGAERKIDWDKENLTPFKKDFYNPNPSVLNRSPEEINKFLKDNDVNLHGENFPAPIFNFFEAGFSEEIVGVARRMDFVEPTPIQSQGWPIALSGENMVGVSRTGSGKTLAYMLPAIVHVTNQPKRQRSDGPIALVLAPTRELARQIESAIYPFVTASKLRITSVFGGVPKPKQEMQLNKGVDICVATPGRLMDFLADDKMNLKRCTYLVLDEADRMFDMGFEKQIRSIFKQVRPDRQVLMWSATWPEEIQDLVEVYLKKYFLLSIGSLELTANPNINQIVEICSVKEKPNLLRKTLNKEMEDSGNKVIIFVQTQEKADGMQKWLRNSGYNTGVLHGGKSQYFRDNVMKSFRENRIQILVATDVAARGLDVSDIKVIINYDYPDTLASYIHRIGRTARHNSTGTSYTFITPQEDRGKVQELVRLLKTSNQEVSQELEELADSVFPKNRKTQFQRDRSLGFQRNRNTEFQRKRDESGF